MQILDRFWSKVDPFGDCWEWTASLNAYGYGQFYDGETMRLAHSFIYRSLVGDYPGDLDHLCRNRRCVNPDHLEPVTRRENIRRGASHVAVQMRQTGCGKGHSYNDVNTYVDGRGKRICRPCVREKVKDQRARGIRYDRKKELV